MNDPQAVCFFPPGPSHNRKVEDQLQTGGNEITQRECLNRRDDEKSHSESDADEQAGDINHGQNDFEKVNCDERVVAQHKIQGEFPLDRLPSDTLLHVFSFLKKNEQLRMSGVCKLWRQLVFSSPDLWRARQMTLRCNRHASRSSRNAYIYARRLGRYLHKLSVACDHPNNHSCRSMAVCFRKLLAGLKTPGPSSLRTFKVTDLRLRCTRASVLLDISKALERLIYSFHHLRCFQMSNAHWPSQEGLRVINSVLTACRHSLHTLRIDGFFLPRFVPSKATDILRTGLGSLTCLSKLSIDYFYLSEQSVVALASSRRGQLRALKLVACDVSPHSRFIPKTAWLALTRACPSMRVKMVVQGFTVSPAQSLPLLLSPALRLHKLRLSIGNQYTFLDMPRLNMAAVLSHVTKHFRRRLTRFEMDIDNHNDALDAALVRMVRKCRNLVSVKVTAYFNSPDTDAVVRVIVRARRDKDVSPAAIGTLGTGSDVRSGSSQENGGSGGGGGVVPYQDRAADQITFPIHAAGIASRDVGSESSTRENGVRNTRVEHGSHRDRVSSPGESNVASAINSPDAGLSHGSISQSDRRSSRASAQRDPAPFFLGNNASTSRAAAYLDADGN